ncbi:MAG: LPS export ABC transporter periplasmic protein LptC [Sulfurovum sp.]|nr:LPS export ABC transporter periplasmic protein LptC [Sulfurovum sp.]MCB4759495.1 LPS export ABC transporter periplasmic protein LptC [Sulfurovum sp.]
MSIKLNSQKIVEKNIQKELEFSNTTFTEATISNREGIAFAAHGVRAGTVLKVDHLRYHNKNIYQLFADSGIYKGDSLYLDGNVTMHQREGFSYRTEHARYDKKNTILYTTSSFVATKGKSVIYGEGMTYYADRQVLQATGVNATLYAEENNISKTKTKGTD